MLSKMDLKKPIIAERAENKRLRDEIERLQRIIDSRPAINAALPESYIRWSQSIYEAEFAAITQHQH